MVIVDYAGDSTKDAWNKKIIERQYAVVLSRLKRSDNRALIIGGREIGARVGQMKRFTCVSSLAAKIGGLTSLKNERRDWAICFFLFFSLLWPTSRVYKMLYHNYINLTIQANFARVFRKGNRETRHRDDAQARYKCKLVARHFIIFIHPLDLLFIRSSSRACIDKLYQYRICGIEFSYSPLIQKGEFWATIFLRDDRRT